MLLVVSEVYVTVTVAYLFAFVLLGSVDGMSSSFSQPLPRPAMRPSLLNLHLVHVSTE